MLFITYGGGHWGMIILETAKPKKKSSKTAQKSGQNRKPHLLSKWEIPKTTLDNKTEKPFSFSTKTENLMLKNEKSANHNEHQNRSLLAQKPKNRSKK